MEWTKECIRIHLVEEYGMRKGRSLEGAHHEEEMGFLSLCRSGLNFKAYRCLLLFFMAGLLLFSWTALLSVPAEAAPLPKNVNARPNSEDREPQKLLSSDALMQRDRKSVV